MKQSIIDNFTGVLDKYSKEYEMQGCMANLGTWNENKSRLMGTLRKNPLWNEDELAVVFEMSEERDVNACQVNDYRNDLVYLGSDLLKEAQEYDNFRTALRTICNEYSRVIKDKNTASVVTALTGVKCSVGQKSSRVINAICLKYGVDKASAYTHYFALLADALNPLDYKTKALLSVNPCDYLEMSNRDNNWRSCHRLNGGEWQAGTLSYMNDENSMIFFTVEDGVTDLFHRVPRLTRQVFAYGNGILLQSRMYPYTNDDIARENYRNIVQKAFADCEGVPNLWTLKRDQKDVNNHVHTFNGSLHYPDYEYESYSANVSFLQGIANEDDSIIIGNHSLCLECGSILSSTSEVNCNSCNCDYVCTACGHHGDEDEMHEINGNWYCDDCCSYCGHCGDYTTDDLTHVHGRYDEIDVCDSCLENYYEQCAHCDEYHLRGRCTEVDDDYYCRSCAETEVVCCNDCYDHILTRDAVSVDGILYCEDCAENHQEPEEDDGVEQEVIQVNEDGDITLSA